jgi:hypothetical protein
MAVRIKTKQPAALLAAIRSAIDKGKIVTWSYDSDGDFTHTPQQFKGHAWLRPVVLEEELQLHILRNKTIQPTRGIYAVFHGRFLEELLSHFPTYFDPAWGTTNPTTDDNYPI